MNTGALDGRVVSVVRAPTAAAKFDLINQPGLSVFRRSRGSNWDREFQRHLALGDRLWFLPHGQMAPISVILYQENGGIPYELVADRSSWARSRSTPTLNYVTGIRVRWPQATPLEDTVVRNSEPALLSIPVADESAGTGRWRSFFSRISSKREGR